MKTIRTIFFMLASVSVLAPGVFAQQKAGTTSMQFLKVMPGARGTALGSAYSAAAIGAEALYWNPAGLVWSDNQEISMSYTKWIFDSKLYGLSIGLPLGNFGAVGLQVQYVDYGKFDEAISSGPVYFPGNTDYPYLTGNTFKPYDYLVGLTYAKKLTQKFSFGLTAKYAYESLYDQATATEYAVDQNGNKVNSFTVDTKRGVFLFDAGFHFNTGYKTIQIAASAQNFGPDVVYKTSYQETKYPAPLLFRLGATGDLIGKNSLLMENSDSRLSLMFDLSLANDAEQQEHVGLEYEFAGTFAVRAGYKFNYTTEGLTFGGGVHQTLGNLNLSVDYSYGALDAIISDYTGNVHRLSVGVGIQ